MCGHLAVKLRSAALLRTSQVVLHDACVFGVCAVACDPWLTELLGRVQGGIQKR